MIVAIECRCLQPLGNFLIGDHHEDQTYQVRVLDILASAKSTFLKSFSEHWNWEAYITAMTYVNISQLGVGYYFQHRALSGETLKYEIGIAKRRFAHHLIKARYILKAI